MTFPKAQDGPATSTDSRHHCVSHRAFPKHEPFDTKPPASTQDRLGPTKSQVGQTEKSISHAANVAGILMVNVVPLPISLSTEMDPPNSSANFFVMDRPRPVPFWTSLSD